MFDENGDPIEVVESVLRPEDDYAGFLAMMGDDVPADASAAPKADNEIPVDPDADDEPNDESDEPSDDDADDVPDDEKDAPPPEDNDEEDDEEGDSDPLEVDIDTVITLPDGTERTIEELTRGFAENTLIAEREEALKAKESEFANRESSLGDKLKLAKLEADDVLEKFEGFDWNALLQESPEEFGKTKMFVERYQTRSREINKAMSDLKAKEESAKDAANQERAITCVQALQKNITGWNSGLYRQILEFAVEKGVDKDYISNCTDPSVITAFYDSMRLAKGENVVKAKVKKSISSPKRVISGKPSGKVSVKASTAGMQGSEATEYADLMRMLDKK